MNYTLLHMEGLVKRVLLYVKKTIIEKKIQIVYRATLGRCETILISLVISTKHISMFSHLLIVAWDTIYVYFFNNVHFQLLNFFRFEKFFYTNFFIVFSTYKFFGSTYVTTNNKADLTIKKSISKFSPFLIENSMRNSIRSFLGLETDSTKCYSHFSHDSFHLAQCKCQTLNTIFLKVDFDGQGILLCVAMYVYIMYQFFYFFQKCLRQILHTQANAYLRMARNGVSIFWYTLAHIHLLVSISVRAPR